MKWGLEFLVNGYELNWSNEVVAMRMEVMSCLECCSNGIPGRRESGFVVRVWIILEIFGVIEIIDPPEDENLGGDGGDVATREISLPLQFSPPSFLSFFSFFAPLPHGCFFCSPSFTAFSSFSLFRFPFFAPPPTLSLLPFSFTFFCLLALSSP